MSGKYIENRMETLIANVNKWDLCDVTELKELLSEIFELKRTVPPQFPYDLKFIGLDITDLPSVEIPDDLDTSYPIWAMDKQGCCLVGELLNHIEHIDEIREFYKGAVAAPPPL